MVHLPLQASVAEVARGVANPSRSSLELGGVTPLNSVHGVQPRYSAATRRCALPGSANTLGLVGAMMPLLGLRRLGVVFLGLRGLVGFFQAHL